MAHIKNKSRLQLSNILLVVMQVSISGKNIQEYSLRRILWMGLEYDYVTVARDTAVKGVVTQCN